MVKHYRPGTACGMAIQYDPIYGGEDITLPGGGGGFGGAGAGGR